jgi:hypothetical protein
MLDVFEAFRFNFGPQDDPIIPEAGHFQVPDLATGYVSGIIVWWECQQSLQWTMSTQPSMNGPSSVDQENFLFNQWKENCTTPTTLASTRTSSTNKFAFSQVDSGPPSSATETVTHSAISPTTKLDHFKMPSVASNNSLNDARHDQQSNVSLNVEAICSTPEATPVWNPPTIQVVAKRRCSEI